jgi:Predicted membrane protein
MIQQIANAIIHSRIVQSVTGWMKNVYLPGFEGVSLFESLNFFRKEIFSNHFYINASAISFSFIMALPPLLLFFFTLIPHLPLPEERILQVLNDMLVLLSPNDTIKQNITDIVFDFIHHKKNVLLSFSVLLTIYFSSNGMMALMNAFDKKSPGFKPRHFIKARLLAILLTFMLILALFMTITFLIVQAWVVNRLDVAMLKNFTVIKIFVIILIIFVCLIAVSFTFKYGPSTESRLSFFSPGAIMSTFLLVLITSGFFYVVNNLVNYHKIYGSIGTLVVFLIWVNLVAQILLIGFELNASILIGKWKQQHLIQHE